MGKDFNNSIFVFLSSFKNILLVWSSNFSVYPPKSTAINHTLNDLLYKKSLSDYNTTSLLSAHLNT